MGISYLCIHLPHFTSSRGFTFLFPATVLLGPRNVISAQFSSDIPIRQSVWQLTESLPLSKAKEGEKYETSKIRCCYKGRESIQACGRPPHYSVLASAADRSHCARNVQPSLIGTSWVSAKLTSSQMDDTLVMNCSTDSYDVFCVTPRCCRETNLINPYFL